MQSSKKRSNSVLFEKVKSFDGVSDSEDSVSIQGDSVLYITDVEREAKISKKVNKYTSDLIGYGKHNEHDKKVIIAQLARCEHDIAVKTVSDLLETLEDEFKRENVSTEENHFRMKFVELKREMDTIKEYLLVLNTRINKLTWTDAILSNPDQNPDILDTNSIEE
jgi:hypothetical protein